MGIVSTILPQSNNMKLLLVVALVAGVHADADADPQLLLAAYPLVFGHGLPLTGAAPAAVEEEAPSVASERRKREAEPEADPEADPLYLTYGYHAPVTYTAPVVKSVEVKTPVVYSSLVHPYTYGYGYPCTYGLHYPYTYGYPHLLAAKPAEEPAVESERKRRDADADAALLYGGSHYPYTYSGYSGYHYPYYAYGK